MRLYRALLRLYPSGFRAEYGADMLVIFAARRQRSRGLGVAWLWIGEALDIVRNAARVHADILRQDLRYTSRALWSAKGFALTAIAVTALGIGATTAAFSVTDFLLIRPLGFADASRLVKIWERQPEYARMEPSPANYRDWKQLAASFESMGAYTTRAANVVATRDPVRLTGAARSNGGGRNWRRLRWE
jgi:putative ABC transport system permease protein